MPGKAQHFQGPQVSCCAKYLLFASNVLFWLLGAAFLAIGLWAWAEKLNVTRASVHYIMVWPRTPKFSVFLGLIFFLELTAGVLAFIFKDWIKDQLNFFINNNVKAYRDDIDLQNLIDFAQEYWSCCGAHGPNDWNLNIYFNCTDSNPSRERCGVPFSCCVKDPAEDVLNTQCGYDVRLKLELEQQTFIHTKGCAGQFEKWLQDNLIVVAGTFVGVALLQIFGICLAQNLVSDINAVKANW
ncbi:tetraspanin-17 isoform X4 [Python bivittatus]|uniref:Tetraspanin n=1 Tax=Python bivittatus TaxID=176946 RepID=A0A9F5MQP3_PYTBI|nr:tetraspanin-17 isoform X4 [Python bivittatus]